MKKVYTLLVYDHQVDKVEKIFNQVRIGLNDWDRSKKFNTDDGVVVNYTIICSEKEYETILDLLIRNY